MHCLFKLSYQFKIREISLPDPETIELFMLLCSGTMNWKLRQENVRKAEGRI